MLRTLTNWLLVFELGRWLHFQKKRKTHIADYAYRLSSTNHLLILITVHIFQKLSKLRTRRYMLDCVTCGFGSPWQEDEEHVLVSQGKHVAKTNSETAQKEKETAVLEDQDLEYLTNKLIEDRELLLKQVKKLTQEKRDLREALDGRQAENRDLLDSIFEW
jgi:hypothetical protein